MRMTQGMSGSVRCLTFLLIISTGCSAVEIDNEITDTVVVCDASRIQLKVETRLPFTGRIFAKGMSKNADCHREFLTFDNGTDTAQLNIDLAKCGMNRERKLSPKPGIMESVTVIISFHYLFITKVDRAFSIQCFYTQQRNEATFGREFIVSEIPTLPLTVEQKSSTKCDYTVSLGSQDGPEARFIKVGDKLVHQWTCAGPDDLKILVKDCTVSDGDLEKFLVVDGNGCAVDPVIIGDPHYSADGKTAFVDTHAFKFADTSFVGFHCTIELCSTENGDVQCDTITPTCSIPGPGIGDDTTVTRFGPSEVGPGSPTQPPPPTSKPSTFPEAPPFPSASPAESGVNDNEPHTAYSRQRSGNVRSFPMIKWPYPPVRVLRDEVDVSSGPMNVLDPSLNARRLVLNTDEPTKNDDDALRQLLLANTAAVRADCGVDGSASGGGGRVCASTALVTAVAALAALLTTLLLSVCLALAARLFASRKTYWWSA